MDFRKIKHMFLCAEIHFKAFVRKRNTYLHYSNYLHYYDVVSCWSVAGRSLAISEVKNPENALCARDCAYIFVGLLLVNFTSFRPAYKKAAWSSILPEFTLLFYCQTGKAAFYSPPKNGAAAFCDGKASLRSAHTKGTHLSPPKIASDVYMP